MSIQFYGKEGSFKPIDTQVNVALNRDAQAAQKEIEGLKLSTVENTEVKETEKETTEVELSTEEEPKPIVHNPENKERVNLGRKISPNRQRTIMDSVYDRIANKNN